jgi:diguanylate cyclase (GGDEF)-like protein
MRGAVSESTGHTAGVALRPVMDMSDGRVIAYDAESRYTGAEPSPAELLDAALRRAATIASAPLLVHVHPALLSEEETNLLAAARTAGCSPAELVVMLPSTGALLDAPRAAAAARRQSKALQDEGYRVGLAGVNPLSVSWEGVVESRPTFLLMDRQTIEDLDHESARAALAGLLAFSGRLGARLIAGGVDDDKSAKRLMEAGVYYGSGGHVHAPVILEAELARPGDLVVHPSWFKERAVRQLSLTAEQGSVHYVASAPRQHVIDDRRLAALLTEWSGELTSAGNPDEVLKALAAIMPQLVQFDRLAVLEADWDRYALHPRVLVGEELQPLMNTPDTMNVGITGWAFLRGQPYRCGRTSDHPEAAPIPGQEDRDESLMVIPLVSGEERLGVLDVWRDGADQFSESDLERAVLLGKLGTDAWRAAKERAELAERVVTDTVTGLLNKRWWDELAPREAAQALRAGSSIALLLIDLDEFKEVNDVHGHASGDLVLKQVARTLSLAVRSGDAVIRFGGDEFVLLLRDCDEAGALEVANDVQLSLTRLVRPAGDSIKVTVSIGVALFPRDGATLEDVVVHSDVAMYRAKALGRDRIAVYSPSDPHGATEADRRPAGTD